MNKEKEISDKAIYEPHVFKVKVKDVALLSLQRHFPDDDPVELEKSAYQIANKVCAILNDHSKSQRVLNHQDRQHLDRLRKRIEFLDQKITERDEEHTAKLKEEYGDNYFDYQKAELSAAQWAVKFIEDHSL